MFAHGTIFHREFSTWQRLILWFSGERSSYGTISSISSSARDSDSCCGSRLQRLAARLDNVEIVPDVNTAHHANPTPETAGTGDEASEGKQRAMPTKRKGRRRRGGAGRAGRRSPQQFTARGSFEEGGGVTRRRDATARQFHATLPTTTARRRSDSTLKRRNTRHRRIYAASAPPRDRSIDLELDRDPSRAIHLDRSILRGTEIQIDRDAPTDRSSWIDLAIDRVGSISRSIARARSRRRRTARAGRGSARSRV